MSTVVRILSLVGLLVCVGSFVWGMSGRFFREYGGKTLGFRVIQVAGAISFVSNLGALLAHDRFEAGPGLAGIALYCLSLVLFWWAVRVHRAAPPTHAFSNDLPQSLVREGPYQMMRHPFYSSYLFTLTAALVATQEWVLLLPLAFMASIYWRAARLEEQKFEVSSLCASYRHYRATTGMFLPYLP